MMGAWVYVDGFNLYYGALKGRPNKWLDLKQLTLRLLPHGRAVEKIKYFTARVSGAGDPDAPRRQQAYLNALATLPEVEIHFGNFLAKTIWRPLNNLPVAGRQIHSAVPPIVFGSGNHLVSGQRRQTMSVGSYPTQGQHQGRRRRMPRPLPDALIVEVHTKEEKGSDVNLAAHLLNDAWKGSFTEAVVISNDTDLVTPIDMVVTERKLPVTVVNPQEGSNTAPALVRAATHDRHINRPMLSATQFANPIVLPNGREINKPLDW